MNNENDSIIDEVWQDLNRQLSREQIGRTVAEISLAYQDATVTAFVPIFIRREAVERLKSQLTEDSSSANGRVPSADKQWPARVLASNTQISH